MIRCARHDRGGLVKVHAWFQYSLLIFVLRVREDSDEAQQDSGLVPSHQGEVS